MVLEHLFPENWLEKKVRYAFLIGFIYSTISLFVARILFPNNTGIVSVALTTLLLIPYIKKLVEKEEVIEEHEKRFSFKHLFKDNKTMIKVYLSLFLAIYFSWVVFSFLLPMTGYKTGKLFDAQLGLEKSGSAAGMATGTSLFFDIFLNNWWVLLATFGLALIAEEGAFFFVVWNASAWGAILGYRAFAAGMINNEPLANLLTVVIITFPHLILEGGAYILALISGQVISNDVIHESKEMKRFLGYMIIILAVYIFVYWTVRVIMPNKEIFSIISIIVMMFILYFCAEIFTNRKHKEVFYYNYYLFIIATCLFIIGALVETIVLMNSSLLSNIYQSAAVYGITQIILSLL